MSMETVFREPIGSASPYDISRIEKGGRIILEAGTLKNAQLQFEGSDLFLTIRGKLRPGTMIDVHSRNAWVELPEMSSNTAVYMKAGVLCLNGMRVNTEVKLNGATEVFRARKARNRGAFMRLLKGDELDYDGLIDFPDNYPYGYHALDLNNKQIFVPADDGTGLPDLQKLWDEGRRPNTPEIPIVSEHWQRPNPTNY